MTRRAFQAGAAPAGTGTDVDQVRSLPEGDHRAELTPGNAGAPAEDEHSRSSRVNAPANLDALVMDHRGIGRRGDFEPNRPLGRAIAASGRAPARDEDQ